MSAAPLRVAYAAGLLSAGPGVPLAGLIARKGRFATSVRDPLVVQALDIRSGESRVTLVSADLLVVPQALHRGVSERTGVAPRELLIAATHTHSSIGGYWNAGSRAEVFMGRYQSEWFELVAATISDAVTRARTAAGAAATMSGGRALVERASFNRRERGGPVDRELQVIRFRPESESPIDLICFGTHPVVVAERDPGTVSADYPGALRSRLEREGVRAMFLQGAVGGSNPDGGPSPDVESRLAYVVERLTEAHAEAAGHLEPIAASRLSVQQIAVPIRRFRSRIVPPPATLSWAGELLLTPVRWWVERMAAGGLRGERAAVLHLARIGDLAILGTPTDLGGNAAIALKETLRGADVRFPLVASHCDGYVGYVHLRRDYDHVPAGSDRFLTLYENAMSFGGWDLGDAFVRHVARAVQV